MLYPEGDKCSFGPTETAAPLKPNSMKCEGYSLGSFGTGLAINSLSAGKERLKMVAYWMMGLLAVIFFLCLSNGIAGIMRNKTTPGSRNER